MKANLPAPSVSGQVVETSAPGSRSGRIATAASLSILLGAALVRLWAIDRQDIWHDEALSLLVARLPLSELIDFTANDVHPPLYYLLLKLWLLPSDWTDWAAPVEVIARARLLGVLISWPLVPLSMILARRWFGTPAGVGAGALAATSWAAVFYAVELRMYGLMLTLSVATVWAYDGLIRDRRHEGIWTLALACLGAALLYTAYAGGLILIGLAVYHGLSSARRRTGHLCLALAGAGVMFAPWLGALAGQLDRVVAGYWIAPPMPLAPLLSYVAFLIGHNLPTNVRLAGLFVVLILLWLSVRVLVPEIWRSRRGGGVAFVWLVAPPAVVFAVSQVRSIYLDRIVLVSAPALYILFGAAIARKAGDWPVRLVAATLAGLVVLSLIGFGYSGATQKAPMAASSRWVAARWQPGDIIVHTSSGSRFPFAIYLPYLPQQLLPDDPVAAQIDRPSQAAQRLAGDPVTLDEAVRGADRLWLIVHLDHSIPHQLELLRRTRERYPLIEETSIGGIGIHLFALRAP